MGFALYIGVVGDWIPSMEPEAFGGKSPPRAPQPLQGGMLGPGALGPTYTLNAWGVQVERDWTRGGQENVRKN